MRKDSRAQIFRRLNVGADIVRPLFQDDIIRLFSRADIILPLSRERPFSERRAGAEPGPYSDTRPSHKFGTSLEIPVGTLCRAGVLPLPIQPGG